MESLKSQKGPNNLEVSHFMTNFANLLIEMGKYNEAKELNLNALKIRKQRFNNTNNHLVASSYGNIGLCDLKLGKF